MDTAKPTMVRVYLDAQETEVAEKLATTLGAETTWVVKRVVAEGLKALAAKGCDQITFPLTFQVKHPKVQAA